MYGQCKVCVAERVLLNDGLMPRHPVDGDRRKPLCAGGMETPRHGTVKAGKPRKRH
jgi:hypothetical protein